jgi:hypothetical protein
MDNKKRGFQTHGSPVIIGILSREPGRIRTCDRLLRRQMLYPAELRVQTLPFSRNVFGCLSLTGPRRILLWLCREDRTRTCDPLVPNQMRYHLRHFPNLYATFLSGKTGTRTQGTLPRPQLSRLLHYHSATFPLGSANLDRKSICAIVFK